jgi:hypothetical protein
MSNLQIQSMFTDNGDGYDISPAGVLILVANTAYGDPNETTRQGIQNSKQVINDMLAAARAGGFAQSDILLTLLARNKMTRQVLEMAQAACNAMSKKSMAEIFTRAGL